MRAPRVLIAGVVAAMSLTLAACVPGEPEPTPTTAESPDPSPEPTPEPTVEIDPHPDLADLIISTSGLGPLTVGLPPATNPGAAMIEWDPDFCSLDEEIMGPIDEPGRWVAAGYDTDSNYMGEPARALYIDADDDGVYRIDVMGYSPHTAEGIRIGATLDELQATYPALQGPHDNTISQVWWLQDANGTVVFETQGEDMLGAGNPEQVILIRVLAAGIDPAWGAANSGNVAGACF